jgi:hypothetical protein
MQPIQEYFPRHVWAILFVLLGIAAGALFVPPSVTEPLGFSLVEHIIVIGVLEFASAVGIGGLVVAYRPTDRDKSEWRYDP